MTTPSPSAETSGPTAGAVGSAGGRPTGFDRARYARRNEVERTVNALKGCRAVATRFDKRAYVFQGTVTVAAPESVTRWSARSAWALRAATGW